jgi:hypothetical protein
MVAVDCSVAGLVVAEVTPTHLMLAFYRSGVWKEFQWDITCMHKYLPTRLIDWQNMMLPKYWGILLLSMSCKRISQISTSHAWNFPFLKKNFCKPVSVPCTRAPCTCCHCLSAHQSTKDKGGPTLTNCNVFYTTMSAEWHGCKRIPQNRGIMDPRHWFNKSKFWILVPYGSPLFMTIAQIMQYSALQVGCPCKK